MGTFFNHPAGNNQNKNTAPWAGLSGTGHLSAVPDWPPARGAMGAFFNPEIQPEKTKMQPRGPACAEPVRGCCAERKKMKEKRKEMR